MGPQDARLLVETFRAGAAAQLGHDLTLEVGSWSAAVEGERVTLDADPRSLRVVEGLRGVKPLTDGDREQIRRSIDAKVLRGQPIRFSGTLRDGTLSGELTLNGRSRRITVVEDRVVLKPSDWGIKPFSALMGALKVRDEVVVSLRR